MDAGTYSVLELTPTPPWVFTYTTGNPVLTVPAGSISAMTLKEDDFMKAALPGSGKIAINASSSYSFPVPESSIKAT